MSDTVQQELQEQRKILEQATAKIKEIEESLAKKKEPVLWEPKANERYIYLRGTNDIYSTNFDQSPSDYHMLKHHNVFHPDDEGITKIHSKQIRLFNQLRRIAIAIDPERKGVFKQGGPNYCFAWSYTDGHIKVFNTLSEDPCNIYFQTEELARKAYTMLDEENKRTFQGDYTW